MEIVILLLIVAVVFVIILPVAAMYKASKSQSQVEALKRQLEDLQWELRRLREQVEARPDPGPKVRTAAAAGVAQGQPKAPAPTISKTEPAVPASTMSAAPPPLPPPAPDPKPAIAPASPAEDPVRTLLAARKAVSEESSAPSSKGNATAASGTASPSKTRPLAAFNWEQFMGVRLFAWLGGLALFLAAAFFVKYSFDHGLIPPWLRVTLGFATGIGLLVGGVLLSQKRYKITADTLCATGVVILYVITFACRSVYQFPFFGVVPTFLLMVLVTATAFLLAVRLNALVVAVLGMLGGFLTPILVSTGQDNPLGLFTYIALLDVGLIAVAHVRRWNWLTLAAAIGTVLMQFGWVVHFFQPEKVFIAMAVFLGFCGLFVGAAAWARRRQTSNLWLIAGSLLMPVATFVFCLMLIENSTTGGRPGVLFTYLLGADLAVVAMSMMHLRKLKLPGTGATSGEREASDVPGLRWLNAISGGAVFLLLALWTAVRVNDALLFWALGGSLGFAVLHTALPITLQRRHPDEPVAAWTQVFPLFALLVALVPIIRFETISFLIWPVILLIDLLAIAAAVATASLAGILLVLVATAVVAFVWILQVPVEVGGLPGMLIVIAGMAAVFVVAGLFAGKKILARVQAGVKSGDAGLLPPGWLSADVQQQIPALGSVLPFLLLVVVTAKVELLNPSPVFGLALLLVGLLLGLTRMANMTWLPAVGLGCSFLVEYAWHYRHFAVEGAPLALGWYLVFYAVFFLYPFLFQRGDGSKVVPWVTSAISGPVHFWLIYELTKRTWPNDLMGSIPALFALPALGGLIAALRQIPSDHPRRNTILAWFGGVALFFITLTS